jgi:dienelactone hydrolase
MKAEHIAYDVRGRTYVGHLARPDAGGARAGVLIAGEGSGLGTQVKERAHQLAELGYVALAIDYLGGGEVLTTMPAMMERLGALRADLDHVRELGRAGLAQLVAQPGVEASRVAAIGYCFGGQLALELARSGAEIAATVAFHATLSARSDDDAKNIRGKVLACIGADDPLVPAEQRLAFEKEMRSGDVDWRLYVYGGAKHGFANPLAAATGSPAVAYDARTHARSWSEMRALFAETID